MDSGKEKMFTVIRSSHSYPEITAKAVLEHKTEWGFSLVYSDKNKLEGNTVGTDAGLS